MPYIVQYKKHLGPLICKMLQFLKTFFFLQKTDKATPHSTTPLPYLTWIVCVYVLICRLPFIYILCSSVLELFLSINVLYYVSCGPQEEKLLQQLKYQEM